MTRRTMSSEQARTEWRRLLDLASQGDMDIIIERHGKATAAVISYDVYQALLPALTEMRSDASASQRGRRMASVLEKLAELPDRTLIVDPVPWQRRIRKDRSLPGRESEC